MIYVFLSIWVISAILCIHDRHPIRIVIYLGIFSTISAVCFFILGAPDVAMAEIAVSSFATIFLIISFEKYFSIVSESHSGSTSGSPRMEKAIKRVKKLALPVCFSILLFALFIYFIPDAAANTYLRNLYITGFYTAVGGENAVTAIYLGYRMYDTLFEALMLLVSVVAATHMSCYTEADITEVHVDDTVKPGLVDMYTIRLICPAMLLFGMYLVLNGHISPGGGFQGGIAIASFFICKHLIHNMYDMHLSKVLIFEKMVFTAIALLAAVCIFMGLYIHFPEISNAYLISMNLLIALKVACGFLVIFYRFVAFERR